MLHIGIARIEDDKGIRDVLKKNYMHGKVNLSFEREPSFFSSIKIEGYKNITIVGKDNNGIIQGFGTCNFRKVFINGTIHTIGYLSDLRLNEEYRNGFSLALGYKKFREIVEKEMNVKYYISSIFADNQHAIDVLLSGRGGFPQYKELGEYVTKIIRPKRKKENYKNRVFRAEKKDYKLIYNFINREGAKYNLFPYYEYSEFTEKNESLLNFNLENIYYTLSNGEITAICGLWDQNSIKQIIIKGYSNQIKWFKYIYDTITYLTKKPKFPKIGKSVKYCYIFLALCKENQQKDIEEIISEISNVAKERGYDFIIIGAMKNTSIGKIVKKIKGIKLNSKILIVDWNNNIDINEMKEKKYHLEVSLL